MSGGVDPVALKSLSGIELTRTEKQKMRILFFYDDSEVELEIENSGAEANVHFSSDQEEKALSVFAKSLQEQQENLKVLDSQAAFILKFASKDFEWSVSEVLLATKNKIFIDTEVEDVELHTPSVQKTSSTPYSFSDFAVEAELNLLQCYFLKIEGFGLCRLHDLFKSGAGALLPWTLISEETGAECDFLWELQALRQEAEPSSDDIKFSNIFLKAVSQLLKDKKVGLKLVEKPYDDRGYSVEFLNHFKVSEPIESLVQKDILFSEGALSVKERKLSLDLKYDFDVKASRMLDSVFHFRDSKSLYVTREDLIREQIKALFSADKIRFQLKSLSFEISEDKLKRSVSYEPSFFEEPLQKIAALQKIIPHKISVSADAEEQKLEKLRLVFSRAEPKRIAVQTPDLSLDPKSLSIERLLKIMVGLKGGVASFLSKDPTNIAVKGNKRLNEIKLLKSSGFFMYLLTQWVGMERGEFEFRDEDFWKKSEKVILEILGHREVSLNDLVSPFFIEFVNKCFAHLRENSHYNVLQVLDSKIASVSFKSALLSFLEPLLLNLSSYYKHRAMLMDQFEGFEIKPHQSVKEGMSLDLHAPCSVDMGYFIKTNECMMDQKQVKILDENMFKAELKVLENPKEESSVSAGPSKMDWFELDPKYYFDGVEISEDQAKAFRANSVVDHDGQLYFIPEKDMPVVRWLNYFWDQVFYKNKVASSAGAQEAQGTSFFRSFVLDILALRQAGIPVEGGPRWQQIAAEYDALDKEDQIELENFKGALKAFQAKGVTWLNQLYKIGLGGILADDMGLGKTVQVLAFLNHLKNLDPDRLNLVVVPTSLVHNWKSEAEKFTPDLDVFVYKSGLQKDFAEFDKGLMIVTYGLLSEHQSLFLERSFDTVIFDEAQQLKNIKSMRSVVSRKLNAKVKLCLTGTPMENHYGEFFSLVDLSVPGALGGHSEFMKIYGPRKVNLGAVGEKEIEYLKLKSKPLVLRRTKTEVLKELPDKTESIVKIDFDDKQKEIYKNVAMSWNSKVQKLITDQGEAKTQIQMFAALMKLRQVCSCPDVVVGKEYNVLSPKLSLIAEQVEELLRANKSVLVFTNFVSTLEALKKELISRECTVLSITGKDSQKKREEALTTFNEDGEKALLMTLKTGGVGLNLTKANYIIHVEPWWNPAAENQGTDRAHRIGQKQSVHVYRYIMNNSIEEKIQTLKESKQEAFNVLLTDKGNEGKASEASSFAGSSGLTKKDFEFLLS